MSNFEIDRIQAGIDQLQTEYEQLRHALMRAKRDEQFEVERIRRNYSTKISSMEDRQQTILRDLLGKKQELKRVEVRTRDQAPKPNVSHATDDKSRRLGRIT